MLAGGLFTRFQSDFPNAGTLRLTESSNATHDSSRGRRASSATQLTNLRAALDRMRQKGGECVALADIGEALLSRDGAFRVFPQASYPFSGAAPLNGGSSGPNSWAILSRDVVDRLYDSTHKVGSKTRIPIYGTT